MGWGPRDHQGVRCSPETGLVPGKAQDAVAVGGVEVVLVRDALCQHFRVHDTPACLGAAPEQCLQGQGRRESGPPHPAAPPGGPPCLAYLCLYYGGALGTQRIADGNGVGQHSALMALAVPTPGAQGHIWGKEKQNETIL